VVQRAIGPRGVQLGRAMLRNTPKALNAVNKVAASVHRGANAVSGVSDSVARVNAKVSAVANRYAGDSGVVGRLARGVQDGSHTVREYNSHVGSAAKAVGKYAGHVQGATRVLGRGATKLKSVFGVKSDGRITNPQVKVTQSKRGMTNTGPKKTSRKKSTTTGANQLSIGAKKSAVKKTLAGAKKTTAKKTSNGAKKTSLTTSAIRANQSTKSAKSSGTVLSVATSKSGALSRLVHMRSKLGKSVQNGLETVKRGSEAVQRGAQKVADVVKGVARVSSTVGRVNAQVARAASKLTDGPGMVGKAARGVRDLLLLSGQNTRVKKLFFVLEQFESVTKQLQAEDLDMADARTMFHGLHCRHPTLPYLALDAEIHHYPNFDNGVAKVLSLREDELTTAEKAALVMFLLDPDSVAGPSTPLSYADELLAPKRRRMGPTASKYCCLKFVLPTSNLVERLFSVAKYILTDHRKHMHPVNFEMIIFLRANASYWNVYSLM
ncbi:hypothetical protein DYB35_008659, partial [Aphanomyces astaci]